MQSSLLQKAPWWISLLLNVGHFFHYLVRMYSQNYCDVRPTEFKDFLVHTAFLNKVGNLEYKKILLKPLEKFFLEMKHSLFFFFGQFKWTFIEPLYDMVMRPPPSSVYHPLHSALYLQPGTSYVSLVLCNYSVSYSIVVGLFRSSESSENNESQLMENLLHLKTSTETLLPMELLGSSGAAVTSPRE